MRFGCCSVARKDCSAPSPAQKSTRIAALHFCRLVCHVTAPKLWCVMCCFNTLMCFGIASTHMTPALLRRCSLRPAWRLCRDQSVLLLMRVGLDVWSQMCRLCKHLTTTKQAPPGSPMSSLLAECICNKHCCRDFCSQQGCSIWLV